jgi:tetratricopeptide (TPR) repeat protein
MPVYRQLYSGFAAHLLMKEHDAKGCVAVLGKLDQVIPSERFGMQYWLAGNIAEIYSDAGADDKAKRFAKITIAAIDAMGDSWQLDRNAHDYPPPQIKVQMLVLLGDYDAAINTYNEMAKAYPDDPNLRARIEELRIEKHLAKRDTSGAVEELKAVIAAYGNPSSPALRNNLSALQRRLAELTHTAPPAESGAGVGIDSMPSR